MPPTNKPSAAPAPGLSWVQEAGEALLWPRLLRVPALAARPQRVVLGAFLLLVIGAIGSVRLPWRDEQLPPILDAVVGAKLAALSDLWAGVLALSPRAVAAGLARVLTDASSVALTDYPIEALLLGVPMLVAGSVLAGAVCRSVACEFSQEITLPWTRQLAFALQRWRSMVGVLVLPWAIVGVIALILAGAGFLCFNGIPGPELLGGLLFGLAVLLGLAAVLCTIAATLAWPMLVPAVACEGTDAIDAAGRALAYALARPIRLLAYLAVAGAVCLAASTVAVAVADGATDFARASASAWVSDRGVAEIAGAATGRVMPGDGAEPVGALAETSGAMVAFWGSCLRVVAGGYIVSMVLTAGTLIYLFMRQICDGQHYAELWTPGEIERSFAAALGRKTGSPDGPTPADPDLDPDD
ncbi:MAG: hypothetical protein IT431_07875 [Phycisphaerales bacterium]|nr:hypothetical protein [Phycisphaerales bacterium]